MIVLTKRNHEKFVVNHLQIEYIETIPESKIVMMNRDFYLVRESVQDIVAKIADYNAKVMDVHRQVTVNEEPKPASPGRGAATRPGFRR